MKVIALIQILHHIPKDTEVILAADPEGNGFNTCEGFEDQIFYNPKGSYDNEISKQPKPGYVPAIILWPNG